MKHTKIYFYLLITLIFISITISCKQKKEDIPLATETDTVVAPQQNVFDIFVDMEDRREIENSESLVSGIAFSGNFASRITKDFPYSAAVRKKMGELEMQQLEKVEFNAWLLPKQGNMNVALVITVTDKNDSTLFWQAENVILQNTDSTEWIQAKIMAEIPKEIIVSTNNIVFYVWNRGETTVFTDDFYINFHTPSRYGKQNVFFFDLENPLMEKITTINAHSGKNSTIADGEGAYSGVIDQKIALLDYEDIGQVGLSSWIYSSKPLANLVLVFSIVDTITGETIFWKGKEVITNTMEANKWLKLNASFPIDNGVMKPNCNVKIYIWNRADSKIFADDFYIVYKKVSFNNGVYRTPPCDLTKMTWEDSRKINYPPYQTLLFKRTDIQNNTSINPNATVLSANFLSNDSQQLFVNEDNTFYFLLFCQKNNSLQKITVPETWKPKFVNSSLFTANDFDGDGFAEILYFEDNKWNIAKFEQVTDFCNSQTKIVVNSFVINMIGIEGATNQIVSGNFSAENKAQIVFFQEDGKIYFVENSEEKTFSATLIPNETFPISKYNFSSMAGNFYENNQTDELMIVMENKESKTFHYKIFTYNGGKFNSVFNQNFNKEGLTIGLDTLKPTDNYIVGNFDNEPLDEIIYISNSWRFDAKLLKFNNESFLVKNTIDFTGYSGSSNPKYYEKLVCVGSNIGASKTTKLLCLAANSSNPNYRGYRLEELQNIDFLPIKSELYEISE